MPKKITDKIKEMLTEKDLKTFESALNKMVEQKVAVKEDELKEKYDALAEEYVTKRVKEITETNKAEVTESYSEKLKAVEKKVVSKLNAFLDNVITEQISDEAINKLAINEAALPIVKKIMGVFENNYIDISTDGSKLYKEQSKKIAELENKLSESHAKNMELDERAEKAATLLMISEKTEGLTDTQKKRVLNIMKNKKFDEVNESIETIVGIVKESANTSTKKTNRKSIIDEVVSEKDNIKTKKPKVVNEEDEEYTLAETANKYLDF